MVNKFCPKCGKPLEEGTLCKECAKNNIKLEYEVPLVQISEFNRVFYRGVWRRFDDLDEVIITRVREALGKDVEIRMPAIEFIPQPKEKTKFKVIAIIDDKEVSLEVKLSYMQCDFGQKQKTAYYEGIMQLREPHEEVLGFINREMKTLHPKGVFITKTVDQKNGVDLYFTNKTQMQILGQKIGGRFGAEVSSHAQLFSHNHQTSKDIYRLNILVVLPKFIAGNVILFNYPRKGILLVQIKSMGKITQGYDLNLEKSVGFELKNCSNIEVYKKQETTVTSTHPEIGVLDPETFQEEIIKNKTSPEGLIPGQKVNIIKCPQGIYFIK